MQRYDDLNRWYAVKGLTAKENQTLLKNISEASGELSKRALSAGRTFSVGDVEKMKEFFMETVERRSKVTHEQGEDEAEKEFACINVLRKGMSKLYGDDTGLTMTKTNTMEETMAQMQKAGRAGAPKVIKFSSKANKPIGKGSGARPDHPETSIWDYLIGEVKARGDIGFSVFGMSMMDGFHSVTLTVDYRNPKSPIVRFTDHTLHHGDGWEAMQKAASGHKDEFKVGSKRGLDEYITFFVQLNWDAQDEARKMTPWIRLWRLHQ